MCKCEQQTNFKVALRTALSETTDTKKVVVWENPENKQIYTGNIKQAESRLKAGKIECYFIPRKWSDQITFKIVDKPEPEVAKPKAKAESENKK